MPTQADINKAKADAEDQVRLNILAQMAEYGRIGRTDYTTKSAIARHDNPAGTLSVAYDMDLDDAKRQLDQEIKVQKATTMVERQFECRREEGAIAIKRVINRVYRSTGMDLIETPWGDFVPPEENIQVGLDHRGAPIFESAPMAEFSLPRINTEFSMSEWYDENQAPMLTVRAQTKVSHKPAIEGFWKMVEDELKWNSIYKHAVLSYKALSNGSYKLEYVHRVADPVFTYSKDVEHRLTHDLWNILRFNAFYADSLQATFKVLLHGPLGTGKTGAVIASEVIAQQCGQTVIEYSPSGLPSTQDLARCMALAKRLGPTMLTIEDYEKFSSADLSANERSALTNLIDGADKRDQVSIVMTTNYIEKIDESLLRGQRMTAAIEIGMLDQYGTEKLLRKMLGDQLDPETDFEAVWKATSDFGPAFLTTCFTKALQVSVGVHAAEMGLDSSVYKSPAELARLQYLGEDTSQYKTFADLRQVATELRTASIGTEGLVGAAHSLMGLRGAYEAVVAKKAAKAPGFKELFNTVAFSWIKEFGSRLRITNKGLSLSE